MNAPPPEKRNRPGWQATGGSKCLSGEMAVGSSHDVRLLPPVKVDVRVSARGRSYRAGRAVA